MGIILMLLASASFATMAAMIKAIGHEIPMTELVFLRSVISAPVLFIFIYSQGLPALVKAKKVLIWRTLFGVTAMHGFFYALTHMPLADCIFIGRSQPLILALLAPYVLGERAPRAAWFAILTGLSGVILIMNPVIGWPPAAWVALGAAVCAAGAHLLLRRLNRTDYPLVIVFNFLVLSAIVTALWVIPNFVPLSGLQWILITGVALFATIGQILMTMAYRRDRAPAVAAASYSSVVLSVVYGYLFWNETPAPLAWLGGTLIIAGGILLVKTRYKIDETSEIECMQSFNTLHDHMARDIRNDLSESFAHDLKTGALARAQETAAAWLAKTDEKIYVDYINQRLENYRKSLAVIAAHKITEPFYQALVLWNRELFFEVHEILEEAWLKSSGTEKEILQAMIRAAGVYIHLANGNLKGAEKMAVKAYDCLTLHRDKVPPFQGFTALLEKLATVDGRPPKINFPEK